MRVLHSAPFCGGSPGSLPHHCRAYGLISMLPRCTDVPLFSTWNVYNATSNRYGENPYQKAAPSSPPPPAHDSTGMPLFQPGAPCSDEGRVLSPSSLRL